MKIYRNAIQTPDGTIIESRTRHDYVTHVDQKTGKTYMVDGGLDYLRRSVHDDQVNLDVIDASHDIARDLITWGTYGPNGDQPYKRIKVSEMEDDHIRAVLRECNPHPTIREVMQEELAYRNIPVAQ